MPTVRCVVAIILTTVCPCFAWGPEGHRVIADVARDNLSAQARRSVIALLGNDDLAAISTWADEIRRERPETFGWHFVDIPWNAGGFDQSRDCFQPNQRNTASSVDHHNCVVDRIELFENKLSDAHATHTERVEALKFLVHFVGDIHQPLHAIARARGGNDIHIVQFGSASCGTRECDLHGTWDIGLVEHAHRTEDSYVAYLEAMITQENLRQKSDGHPEDWANESFRLAHQAWLNDGGAVDEKYYRQNIKVLDEQLALAGLRLAKLLNEAMGNRSSE